MRMGKCTNGRVHFTLEGAPSKLRLGGFFVASALWEAIDQRVLQDFRRLERMLALAWSESSKCHSSLYGAYLLSGLEG